MIASASLLDTINFRTRAGIFCFARYEASGGASASTSSSRMVKISWPTCISPRIARPKSIPTSQVSRTRPSSKNRLYSFSAALKTAIFSDSERPVFAPLWLPLLNDDIGRSVGACALVFFRFGGV